MSDHKKLATFSSLCLALFLTLPTNAEVSIIIGQPYYKNNNSYNNPRAADYNKRHNFANKYQAKNPYLNYDYSVDRSRYKEQHTYRKPRYSDRFNSLHRHSYGYQRPVNYKQGYRQGYRQGFIDGYTHRKPTSQLGGK